MSDVFVCSNCKEQVHISMVEEHRCPKSFLPASHPDAVYVSDYFGPNRGAYISKAAAQRALTSSKEITEYVAGFAFSEDRQFVLLLKKNRAPRHAPQMMGKWNGVGGKLEANEHPSATMVREFCEETGVLTVVDNWTEFLTLRCAGAVVHFFHAHLGDCVFYQAYTKESEAVEAHRVSDVDCLDVMPNLRWIIPMALGHLNDNVQRYEVIEVVTHTPSPVKGE